MLRLTPIVKNLLLINVGIFILRFILPFNITPIMALWYVGSEAFAPYQFITYMFAHGDFGHIFFNMLALFFIGPMLESFWGAKRFLIFYIVTGIGAGVLYSAIEFFDMQQFRNKTESYLESPGPESFDTFINTHAKRFYGQLSDFIDEFYDNPQNQSLIAQSREYVKQIFNEKQPPSMVGASGAIYGLIMAIALMFPNTQFFLIFPPIPIKAKYLALILAGISIYMGLQRNPNDMIAHFAHLGGMVFAYILIRIWRAQGSNF